MPAVGQDSSRRPSGRIMYPHRIAGGSYVASPCCACNRRNLRSRLLSRQEIPHVSGAARADRVWRRPLLSRLGEDDSLQDLSHQNVRLSRRQALRDEVFVNQRTKHRPGVAGLFKLNHDLPDHGPTFVAAACASRPSRLQLDQPRNGATPAGVPRKPPGDGVSADLRRRRGRVVRTYRARRQLSFLLTRLFVAAILTARFAYETTFMVASASTTPTRS